jgi:glycosyltransferase involved in cell wall biosynthesis
MKLTIAICTYKRYELIDVLLKKIETLNIDFSQTEILIIDNTPSLERIEIKCEFVKIVYSSPPGLSRARNLAIECAMGEYIAFIDDDAFPSETWYPKIIEVINEAQNEYSIICGPIRPIWPNNEEPEWLPQKYKGCIMGKSLLS